MSRLSDRLRRQFGEPSAAREVSSQPAGEGGHSGLQPPGPELSGPLSALQRLRQIRNASCGLPAEASAPRLTLPAIATNPRRPVCRVPRLVLEEIERAGTSCLWGRLRLPPTYPHGAITLGDVMRVDGRVAAMLSGDEALSDFDPTRALFFDLETTGLLGGSGNLAFLAGAVRLEGGGDLVVHQVLIREPSEEPAALALLAELLSEVEFLVSFNGKSFDRNVLADRFVMNRMSPSRVLELPHLDLLHPARRLFRGVLRGCGLGQIEEACLGVFRHESEVRGAEVPQRWFDFLHLGRMDLLEPVLEHNLVDILSLVTLAGHLARCLSDPGAALPQPRALLGLARLLLERGAAERGEEILRLAAHGSPEDPVVYAALGLLAEQLRKTDRHQEALVIWRTMISASGTSDLRPWRRAAIALEHRLGRSAEARELVETLLGSLEGPDGLLAFEIEGFRHRLDRLVRRAAVSRAGRARAGDPDRAGCAG
ncbi:MAG: ribonuclease H-like domain-containing protein [Myxococcota bacterium]|nr:ribonuclease H-like domain-containing protein [Myxococcota bacterium]